MNNDDDREIFNKVVAKKVELADINIYILESIFKHSDDFKGATGTVVRPVTKAEYDDSTSDANVREYVRDMWQMAVQDGSCEEGLDDYIEDLLRYENVSDVIYHDQLFGERAEQVRALGFSEEEYPVLDVVSGGRCFKAGETYDEVYEPELLKRIEEVEKK